MSNIPLIIPLNIYNTAAHGWSSTKQIWSLHGQIPNSKSIFNYFLKIYCFHKYLLGCDIKIMLNLLCYTQMCQVSTLFGPLLIELQLHQFGIFDSCNEYVIVKLLGFMCAISSKKWRDTTPWSRDTAVKACSNRYMPIKTLNVPSWLF